MKNLLGKNVNVHLASCGEIIQGLLFDIEEEYVHIQYSHSKVVVIPKENVNYYSADFISNDSGIEPPDEDLWKNPSREGDDSTLKVSVDGQLVSKIPVSPSLNLATCSNEVLGIIWNNHQVKQALINKTQKALEYDVGYANIITNEKPDVSSQKVSFDMGVGTGASQTAYANQSEIIKTLKNK